MADVSWAANYHVAGASSLVVSQGAASSSAAAAPVLAATLAGAELTWEDLSWRIEDGSKTGKCVLQNLIGRVAPGTLMAVMGPSGSGKTTLLDILAMRKTVGSIEGSVRVNGQDLRSRAFQRASACVLQENVLLPTLTVSETMWYYAEMMLPVTLSAKQKLCRVTETLQVVGLSNAKSTMVGGPLPGGYGLHGLSSGERKRLSIAAAMLTKPSLVFADEPTTGIDAFASLRIVEVLKELATSGKSVVVTLHQPRDAVWRMFDHLYLLSEGRLLFSGKPSEAPSWFESIGYQAPVGVSMADWLLDVVTIGFDKGGMGWRCFASSQDVADAATNFSQCEIAAKTRKEVIATLAAARLGGYAHSLWPDVQALGDGLASGVAAVPRRVQLWALLVRHALNYSRNVGNIVARLLLGLVAGLLVGVCYSGLRNMDEADAKSLTSRAGSLFLCCLILMMSPNCSMGLFVADRRFYSVEAAAQLYSSISYYVPLAFCELVVNLAAASLFWTPVSLLSGAGNGSLIGFLRGLLTCGLIQLCGSQIVCMSAMLLPNQELAFVTSVAINIAAFITAGFLVKTSNLPRCVSWVRYLSPVKFGFHSLVLNEVAERRFDVRLQLERLDRALCEVGRSGCARVGAEPSAAVSWWLQMSPLQNLTRTALGDMLDSIDPCLFQTVRNGPEALACLQLDEPSATEFEPSLLALLAQLVVLHAISWLALRFLHKERR